MRPVVTDQVAWSDDRSDTLVSPAKTAEPIEMPFGLRNSGGPKESCSIRWGSRSPMGRGNFEEGGEGQAIVKGRSAVSCAKTAETIEMPFGLRTRVGPRIACIRWGAHWRNLANTIETFMCGDDAACCQITLATCFLLVVCR